MRPLLAAVVAVLVVPFAANAAGNPVVSAVKRTATAETSTLKIDVTTTIAGRPTTTMTGSGVQRGSSVKLTMRTKVAGETMRVDAVLLNERGAYVMYMRSPTFQQQLPEGKSWLRIDLSKQASSVGVDFSSLFDDAQVFAPLEKGLVSTKKIGRTQVAGTSTTQYRAIIDVQRAARLVPAYGKQVRAVEKATGVRLARSPWDVWVAADGRIRRMRFATPAAANGARGTTTQSITFLAFDKPVSITAPPRAQVVSP